VRAREFLARTLGADGFVLRNVVKEPLSESEIRALAKRAGTMAELVAPRKRDDAAGMSDAKLAAWLAGDGGRLRRPIVVTAKGVILGFAAGERERLEKLL